MENAPITPPKGHTWSAPASIATQLDPRATSEVYRDVQLRVLQELKTLVELQKQAAPKPPVMSEFLYNFLLQIMGLALATLFGAFSILAWRVSEDASRLAAQANNLTTQSNELTTQANELTTRANQLATSASCDSSADNLISIVEFCQTSPRSSSDLVDSFANWVQDTVSDVDSCFGSAATSGGPSATSASAPSPGNNTSANAGQSTIGAIVGGVIAGLLLALILFWLKYKTYQSHMKRLKGSVIPNSYME
ncbi:hypothetical protein G7054_g2169 [Neopestalotiopsis clavispora]|nr:hypothetical protein G7054_g2169 [Neopestalotiopsis clavispora]